MKIKDILNEGVEILKQANIEDPILKSRILLSYILKKEKEYLITHDEDELSDEIYKDFIEKIKRLKNGEPIQYITNKQEFMGIELYVNSDVLIPQPDTEILVEEIIFLAQNTPKNLKILDLCTGSGAIVISLGKILRKCELFASDISPKALNIAQQNSIKNNTQITFIESNLFENISEQFDIIVSNPPYIETETINTLSKEVRYEPLIALDGGKDGLEFYRKIITNAKKYLKENGYLALEIGYNQREKVEKILINNKYKNIYSKKDLSGNDRIVIAQK